MLTKTYATVGLIDSAHLFSNTEATSRFGTPGENGTAGKNLIRVEFPFKCRLYVRSAPADLKATSVNKNVAEAFHKALTLVAENYTAEEIVKFGLDVFSGCYNPRMVRGSKTTWSKHAFGIASDWLASENDLHTPFEKATFGQPQYKDYLDCWLTAGFANLGKLKGFGRDAMHFEFMKKPN